MLIRDQQGQEKFARIKVPDTLPQLIPLNPKSVVENGAAKKKLRTTKKPADYVWIEEVIAADIVPARMA